MKTMKLILSAILLMVAFTVQAQTVQVYKDGAVVKEYPASEVASVEVKRVYYYYAGWECPRNEEELARLAVEPNGGSVDMTKTYTKASPIRDLYYTEDAITSTLTEKAQYYIVVPNGHSVYDDDGDVTSSQYDEVTNISIPNHKIWKSAASVKFIKGIYIY